MSVTMPPNYGMGRVMQIDRYASWLLSALVASILVFATPAFFHFAAMRIDGFELPEFLQTIGFVEARLSLVFAGLMIFALIAFSARNWRAATTARGMALLCLTTIGVLAGPFWYYRANIVEHRAPIIVERASPPEIKVIYTPMPISPMLTKLEVRQIPTFSPSIQAAYDRDSFPKEALESFEAFHSYLRRLYEEASPVISSNWGIGQRTAERAAFYSIAVGTLFAYGNKQRPDLSGCTTNNEIHGGVIEYTQSQRQFLNSSIGCCNDYAYLMKILLDRDGIKNRMLVGAGHIWNEFTAAGHICNVDANTGLLIASSWADLKDADRILVWEYPLAGAMPSAGERYRPVLGAFPAYMLAQISAGGFPVEAWDKIPMEFPLEDGVITVTDTDSGASSKL